MRRPDLFNFGRVNVWKMAGEDVVDQLIRQIGEDELAFRHLSVLDGLNEADDPRI